MKTKISEINLLYCPWIYHSKIITSCSLREGVACTDTFHCDQQLWDAVDKELHLLTDAGTEPDGGAGGCSMAFN